MEKAERNVEYSFSRVVSGHFFSGSVSLVLCAGPSTAETHSFIQHVKSTFRFPFFRPRAFCLFLPLLLFSNLDAFAISLDFAKPLNLELVLSSNVDRH
jgi:hypothetical protein